MNIQQLKYVITISETGSFNKASEVLYITQPSLTSSIQDLERELGITIFNRSSRGASLTSDGLELKSPPRHSLHDSSATRPCKSICNSLP